MLKAIEGIEEALAGKTFEDFSREWLLNHGIQRGMEIISEASRHLALDLKKTRPEIRWTASPGSAMCYDMTIMQFPMKSSGRLYVMIYPLSGLRSNQFCLI
jgi:uncharacterized protein with HEPN domain